jgi:hypothetical protein
VRESIEAALFNTGKALTDDNISCASSLAKEIPPLSSLACWVGVTGDLVEIMKVTTLDLTGPRPARWVNRRWSSSSLDAGGS